MMQAYDVFARVYDEFMDDIPYDDWADHLVHLFHSFGIEPGALVCELGCGTGQMTVRLAKAGYDLIGVDASVSMLGVAMENGVPDGAKDILYLCQDMRSFELYGTVAAIVSVCDSMNYVMREEELGEVFALAKNYLDPGGILAFDVKTPYFYSEVLGDSTFADSREDAALIWENSYDPLSQTNTYDLTFFLKDEDGRFTRELEGHCQKAYDTATIRRLLEEAGLAFISVTDMDTMEAENETSRRLLYVAQYIKGGTIMTKS